MTSIRPAVAALITVGLISVPCAAGAKTPQSTARHHRTHAVAPGSTRVVAPTYSSASVPVATPPRTYGSSGQSIGTVTAPSVGTYNWPSVGVTNAVPTWRNTNPR
jgi:hypothetical protein